MIEIVRLTYDPRTDRDALVIDGEMVPIACKCRPYIMERLADLRISEPDSDEIDQMERERDEAVGKADKLKEQLADARMYADSCRRKRDDAEDDFDRVIDALRAVAKLLKDDCPKAALQVAEKALGIDQ